MNKTHQPVLLLLFNLIWLSSCQNKIPVDLILYNARVYTVDADFTLAEAFAVQDGKFLEVGSSSFIRAKVPVRASDRCAKKAGLPRFYRCSRPFCSKILVTRAVQLA